MYISVVEGAHTLQALWFTLVSEHFQALSPGQLPEVDSVPGERSFGTDCLANRWTDVQQNRTTRAVDNLLVFDFKNLMRQDKIMDVAPELHYYFLKAL